MFYRRFTVFVLIVLLCTVALGPFIVNRQTALPDSDEPTSPMAAESTQDEPASQPSENPPPEQSPAALEESFFVKAFVEALVSEPAESDVIESPEDWPSIIEQGAAPTDDLAGGTNWGIASQGVSTSRGSSSGGNSAGSGLSDLNSQSESSSGNSSGGSGGGGGGSGGGGSGSGSDPGELGGSELPSVFNPTTPLSSVPTPTIDPSNLVGRISPVDPTGGSVIDPKGLLDEINDIATKQPPSNVVAQAVASQNVKIMDEPLFNEDDGSQGEATVVATPEPATAAIWGGGLLCVALGRRLLRHARARQQSA